MGWFSGFPFQSKEQMEKERRDFEKRVLPFGLPQRECAAAVLKQLLPNVKRQQELLFAFINAKDMVTLCDDNPEEGLAKARRRLENQRVFAPGDITKILALVLLDTAAPGLEEYPTAQAVLEQAEKWETS